MSFLPLSKSLRNFPWIKFVFWAAVFAAAYAQSPLFTSNQNQYFLPGLAQAGYGDLANDWLANTQDPTPAFSALVSFSYALVGRVEIFYLEYAVLMGIYLACAVGIARQLTPRPWTREEGLVFLTVWILIHSAGWRFLVSRLLGIDWTYVLEDGFASQRMLGPVLEPSAFGVALLLSVYLFLRRRYYWAALAAVSAAIIHPTYLLSAALLVMAYMLHLIWNERRWQQALGVGCLALVFVSPTVYQTLRLFGGPPNLAEQARQILVTYRIPHHALLAEWWNGAAVVKTGLMLGALYLARRTRLFSVLLVSATAIASLTAIQLTSGNLALALLFPWRPSIYLLPLAMIVILARGLSAVTSCWSLNRTLPRNLTVGGSWLLIGLAVIVGVTRFSLDLERKAAAPEHAIEVYVAAHHQTGQVYLTPVKMQDFRLAAGAPVYIDFKSIPYRSDEVLEWYTRVRAADSFYQAADCDWLAELSETGEVTHVVWPVESGTLDCPFLERQYEDTSFILYRLPEASPTKD